MKNQLINFLKTHNISYQIKNDKFIFFIDKKVNYLISFINDKMRVLITPEGEKRKDSMFYIFWNLKDFELFLKSS